MDVDIEPTGEDGFEGPDGTTRIRDVRRVAEEVDVSVGDPMGVNGHGSEGVPAQAILAYEDPDAGEAQSPDGVYPNSRIRSGRAADGEVLRVRLAMRGNTRSVDRVLEFETTFGPEGDDEESARRRTAKTTVRLDDASEWNLTGRAVSVTADTVDSITGD